MSIVSKKSDGPVPSELHKPSTGVLYLTSVAGTFDEAQDIALGPHCFIDREEVFAGWQGISFADAIPSEAAIETAEENLRRLVNHLLPGVAEKLNAFHGTSYSVGFWRLIVLPWMIEIAQRAWVGYARLQKIARQNEGHPLTVPVLQDDFEWQFADTAQLRDAMLKDYRFNWWIDSQIAAALAPAAWTFVAATTAPHPPQRTERQPTNPDKGRVRNILRNIKYWIGYSDIIGIRWAGLMLALYVNLLPKRPSQLRFQPDAGFQPEEYFSLPFLNALKKLMDATMPESFLGGFLKLEKKAKRIPYWPGRLRLGALSFWNEQEKVIAAFATEAGEKRVVYQHGGEYGMLKYNMMANEMELRSCIFISWGWLYDQPSGGHILPLASPYHSKIADKHRRMNDDVIVIGQPIRIQLNRLHWWSRSIIPEWYCRSAVGFLEGLDEKVRRSVVFRPYTRAANDIEIRDIVEKRFPDMTMLETDLNGALMKCRLAVLPSFGTTMNQTMAANIPTVVHLPPDLMTPREEAEPYFKALRQCGVIHDSADAASAHINAIWDDVEGWWSSKEVQVARKIWSHQFARTDRFWWWQWMKALAKLKDVG